jgi:ABC-type enterochelin transport system substrate-binding protein
MFFQALSSIACTTITLSSDRSIKMATWRKQMKALARLFAETKGAP